ncbi:8440_t:CDS:1, partial [Cetraspora pellucida]
EEKCRAVELAHYTLNSHVAQLYSLDLTMLGRWVKKFSQDSSPHSQKNA